MGFNTKWQDFLKPYIVYDHQLSNWPAHDLYVWLLGMTMALYSTVLNMCKIIQQAHLNYLQVSELITERTAAYWRLVTILSAELARIQASLVQSMGVL